MLNDSKQVLLNRLAILLTVYKDYIGVQNGVAHFDVNRLSEGLMADLLSNLSNWGRIENLGVYKTNQICIDLLSADKHIGIQVTSDSSAQKVKETIAKYKKLDQPLKELYILMLRGMRKTYPRSAIDNLLEGSLLKFDVDKHIVDLNFIYDLASHSASTDGIVYAIERLEEEIGSWAVGLIKRHRSSAGRILQLCKAHDLRPTEIYELLGYKPSSTEEYFSEVDYVEHNLTSEVLSDISQEFHVPIDWITTESDYIGEYGQSCTWRSFSDVYATFEKVLRQSGGEAIFYVVTPTEIENFLEYSPEGLPAASPYEAPILLFCKTNGRYGKVYQHLGIQPGEIEHYRKATIFLVALIRKLQFDEKCRFKIGVSWALWPKVRILETAGNLLLASAMSEYYESYLDGYDYADFSASGWSFPTNRQWDKEFNEEYAPWIERNLGLLKLDAEREFEAQYRKTLELLFVQLPAEKMCTTRIYGQQAILLAISCGIDVSLMLESDDSPRLVSPSEAIERLQEDINASTPQGAHCIVYLDVVPSDFRASDALET